MADLQTGTANQKPNKGMNTSDVETVGDKVTQPKMDQFGRSYADPVILQPDWSQHYNADPFQSQPPNMIDQDISTVDPLAGIKSPGEPVIPVQNVESDLIFLRAELPFIPIMKFPRTIKTAYMAAANTPTDIIVPEGAALVKFRGPGDWYVSMGGRAIVPGAGGDVDNASIYKPDAEWFYCGGIRQISVVATAAAGIVQAIFIMRPSP